MVKVTGRKGNVVEVDVLGIRAVIDRLRSQGKDVEDATDLGVIKAGGFIEEEVKESIMGNRAEPKSVDTGRLGNSIEFEKTGRAQGVVKPKKESYPEGGANTQEVATFLEFGTSRINPRRHFRNTKTRNRGKISEIINKEIRIRMGRI